MNRKLAIVSMLCVAILAVHAESSPPSPKRAALPVALNLIPGLGIGSFVQGDLHGGIIGLGGEVIGGGVAVYGLGYAYANVLGAVFVGAFGGDTGEEASRVRTGLTLMCVGGAVWVVTKVYEIVRPISYARDYNAEHDFAKASFAPVLVPTSRDGSLSPGLVLSLSF